jgi:hypothetical protein
MLTSKGFIENLIFSVCRRYSIPHQMVIMGGGVEEEAEIPESISA